MIDAHYHLSRLDSGLVVVTAEMPSMASVCVGLWVRIGSRYEAAEANGIYHFVEHMLFKGTRKRSSREITQAVEGIGGSIDAFTGEESTCIYARAQADRFEDLVEVILDMILHSRFATDDIEKERAIIKEELAMYLDQPQHLVDDLVCETLWPDHPLGRPLTGTEATIDSFRRPHVLRHQQSGYAANNSVIVVAGNVRHRQVLTALSRHARTWKRGVPPRFPPANNAQDAPRFRVLVKDSVQTQIACGIRTCSRHDPHRYALRLLNALLGENMSSRLFQVVREDHGLAYNIHSCVNLFEDTGDLIIYAGVDPDDCPRALKLIARELNRFVARPPGAKEFKAARDFLLGQLDLGLEGTENHMMWLGEQLIDYGKIISPALLKHRLSAVKPVHVQAVAKDFLKPANICLAMVGPKPNRAEILKVIEGLKS